VTSFTNIVRAQMYETVCANFLRVLVSQLLDSFMFDAGPAGSLFDLFGFRHLSMFCFSGI